ncbi:hypothetical protein GQ600_20668 [Phytophthora cactorum]|nr:hypothetical protein GQ600_20668 [Phytophthora cactorum]
MAFQARWRELKKLGWQSRKPTGLSNLHTYLKPGKKKKDGVPGRDFFVGEEELMKYLDRVDLGTFERYSSASMSSDVAYRYLAQRCYTEATRKQPSASSHEATKPRSQASGQSRREAATTERGSGERSQGKDDTGASTELGGEGMLAYYSRKPTGLSNLHTYLKPGKKKKDGVPGRDFFVGEEELMKYLDRVDLGTFERYSSASMSSDVAYRYLAQRCYTEATRKQPRRQQRSHEATKPRSQASGQSRREAATTERGSGERSQGKDDTGASTELGGEDHSSPVQDEVILAIPAVLSPESGAMTRVVEGTKLIFASNRRNLTADFGEATSSEVPDTLTAHKSIQSATTSKDAILEDTCNDKEAPCATTETVSGLDTYATLVLEGEDDVGTGWDTVTSDFLTWTSRKPTGLSNLHTYLKPGKKKKDGVPGRDFFVGEEELMKYLDRVDLGTFERYSSASMSSDVAYRYLAQRCYTEATRKQPRRQQRSHEATKPRTSKRPKQA